VTPSVAAPGVTHPSDATVHYIKIPRSATALRAKKGTHVQNFNVM